MSIAPMAVATGKAHAGKPIWVTAGGAGLPVTNIAVATALTLAGPGAISFDALLGTRLSLVKTFLLGVGIGVGTYGALTGAFNNLLAGAHPAPEPEPAPTTSHQESPVGEESIRVAEHPTVQSPIFEDQPATSTRTANRSSATHSRPRALPVASGPRRATHSQPPLVRPATSRPRSRSPAPPANRVRCRHHHPIEAP